MTGCETEDKDSVSTSPLALQAPQAAILKSLWLGNLVIFACLAVGAFLMVPWFAALSVVIGGLVALINFKLLQRTVIKAILPRKKSGTMGVVLFKYYLRFAATAVLLLILMRLGWADPLGLMVGLSVVVLSIFVHGAVQAHKLFKEGR